MDQDFTDEEVEYIKELENKRLKVFGTDPKPEPLVLRYSASCEYPTIVHFVTKDHYGIIMDYIERHYMTEYVFWKMLGLSKECVDEFEEIVTSWLDQGTSFLITHETTGHLLGFVIGTVWSISDWQRETERIKVHRAVEIRAAFSFSKRFHELVDLYLIHNTDRLYVVRIWMIAPKLKRYYYVLYELLLTLVQFCERVKARAITAIATTENQKTVLEHMGFNCNANAHYFDWLWEYIPRRRTLGDDYFAYLMSYTAVPDFWDVPEKTYDVITIPDLKQDSLRQNKITFWQELYWNAFSKEYFIPSALKDLNPDYIIS